MTASDHIPDISVISPVYRNKANLRELHERICRSLTQQVDTYEIIFVNDKCPEDSLSTLRELARDDPNVAVLALAENVGQQRAVMQAIRHARGAAVITMDADLQDPPEAIPELITKMKEGYAVVFAGRRGRYEEAGKLLTSRLYKTTMHWLCGVPKDAGMYLIMNRQAADRLLAYRENRPSIIAMLGCTNLPMTSIPVHRQPRTDGVSTYGSWKRLKLGLRAVWWVLAWKSGIKRVRTPKEDLPSQVSEFIGARFEREVVS